MISFAQITGSIGKNSRERSRRYLPTAEGSVLPVSTRAVNVACRVCSQPPSLKQAYRGLRTRSWLPC